MVIKNGYAGEPFEIRVDAGYEGNVAEVWTDMFDQFKFSEREVDGDTMDDRKFRTEVLHYATLTEVIELRNELNGVIKQLAGV